MANKAKYLLLLETLKFHYESEHNEKELLAQNVEILKKFVKLDLRQILTYLTQSLQVQHLADEINIADDDQETRYVVYLTYALHDLTSNTNFNSDAKEDLISTHHLNLCIEAVQNLSIFALRQQLHAVFCTTGIFANVKHKSSGGHNYALLQVSIETFAEFLKIKQLHMANALEQVVRDYMAAIYTLLTAQKLNKLRLSDIAQKRLQTHLNFIWQQLTKVQYLRNLMLLKGIPKLPIEVQKLLHHELLQKLMAKDGFTTLVATLQIAQQGKQNSTALNDKTTFEIIANIVAHRGHTRRFQTIIIKQIFAFLKLCLLNDAMADSMSAGLLALRRLYDLCDDNRVLMRAELQTLLQQLCKPTDMLTGLILMEHNEFCLLTALLFQLFCTSIVECLPSDMLICYLPLMLQLYYHMPVTFLQKQQVGSVVMRCLNNRTESELQLIIEKLFTQKFDADWQQLHERVVIYPNAAQTELMLKIAACDFKQEFSISLALPELLMSETYHLLTYRLFMILLNLMSEIVDVDECTAPALDLLQTDEELVNYFNAQYPVKVELLLALNTLITHAPLRTQITEHSKEFLQFLRAHIVKRIATSPEKRTESNDQTLLLLLTLMQELLEQTAQPEAMRDFIPTLQQLQKQTHANQLIKQCVACLLTLLQGELKANAAHNATAYQTARTLIETQESHLQVYGIQMLLDLLRRRDAVTCANAHLLIALALSTLHHKESYTFLNFVRLFVGLVDVLEAQVLEVLADEYLNDANGNMDYRLVVGEALLKVAQQLGPLVYKYKGTLLNCFMHGARAKLDEFRMSSYANLAQMCRLLAYQVHSYFQELLNLINCELTSGHYVPAKRAAVLVLSELLEGMDNLLDFEQMLLPIYRLLKTLEAATDCDAKMRLHAANGLKALSEKCKKLLFPTQQLEKQIQVLGIKEPASVHEKPHILELN